LTNPLAVVTLAVLASLAACANQRQSASVQSQETSGPLFDTISALDAAAFEAFNTCANPDQLQKHADYFSADVEFYHDTGGVTWNRREMLANTEKYVCGNFRRELIPGSFRVYPIKDLVNRSGVQNSASSSQAPARSRQFLIVWRKEVWWASKTFWVWSSSSLGMRPNLVNADARRRASHAAVRCFCCVRLRQLLPV
jgi:hypothetical protein